MIQDFYTNSLQDNLSGIQFQNSEQLDAIFGKIKEIEVKEDASIVAGVSISQGETQKALGVLKKKKDIGINSFRELAEIGSALAAQRKVFGDYILEDDLVLFPAERGVGKTFLSLQLAIAVAEGYSSFLGEEIGVHGNTIYLNMELGEEVLCRRINHLYQCVAKNETMQHTAYGISSRKGYSSIKSQVEAKIKELKPVLVIVDNLRTLFRDSNNEKNSEMTNAISELKELKDKYNFALVLVHHTKKNSSTQLTNSDLQSGAGAVSDLVDSDFFLRKSMIDKGLRILKRDKSRNASQQENAKLIRLNPDTLWFEMVEEDVDESLHIFAPDTPKAERAENIKLAKQLKAEGKTLEQIGEEIGKDKGTISRWLKLKTVA